MARRGLRAFVLAVMLVLADDARGWTLSLDGASWKAINGNGTIAVPATVPGEIHLDLLAAGVIDEPYYRFNDVAYQWIALDEWKFTRGFDLTAEQLADVSVTLYAQGLATVASVFVNDEPVATSTNMFQRYLWPVTRLLVVGRNTISVSFVSTVGYAASQFARYPLNPVGGVGVPPICPPAIQNGFCHPNFVRTTASSFSWDWGPAFAPMGIFRSLELVATQVYIVDALWTATPASTPVVEGGAWALDVNVSVYANVATTAMCSSALSLNGVEVATSNAEAPLDAGMNIIPMKPFAALDGVKLWWPNGLGAPVLYTLRVRCGSASKEVRVGFRTAELIQDPMAGGGRSFYFQVNGVPVFAKGSNWVPADSFESRITDEYMDWLFDSYVAASFNIIRVWGGGLYQRDSFYDRADAAGILIWQEAMFACAMYPVDKLFLESVGDEVADNMRRIQSHPSVIVFSGSNENEVAIADNWYGTAVDQPAYVQMFVQLYWDVVLPTFEAVDATRVRLSSSPSNGNETAAAPIATDPNSPVMGDQHTYLYLADGLNVTSFPSPRFTSEFGYQSYPSLLTLAPVANASAGDWAWDSAFMAHRNHHPNGSAQIVQQLSYHFGPPLPGWSQAIAYDNWLFMSQVIQAMCMRTEAEHYRRSRSVVFGSFAMGTIYWQANDIWQGASWSSIEYGGRWKVLHSWVQRFYAPLLVSPYTLTGAELTVVAVNDAIDPLNASVRVTAWPWGGDVACGQNTWPMATVAANDATMLLDVSLPDTLTALNCFAPIECALVVELVSGSGAVLATNEFLPASPSNLTLVDPELAVASVASAGDRRFQVNVTLTSPALFLWLETTVGGRFEPNGMLATPPLFSSTFVARESSTSAHDIAAALRVTSLWDRYTGAPAAPPLLVNPN